MWALVHSVSDCLSAAYFLPQGKGKEGSSPFLLTAGERIVAVLARAGRCLQDILTDTAWAGAQGQHCLRLGRCTERWSFWVSSESWAGGEAKLSGPSPITPQHWLCYCLLPPQIHCKGKEAKGQVTSAGVSLGWTLAGPETENLCHEARVWGLDPQCSFFCWDFQQLGGHYLAGDLDRKSAAKSHIIHCGVSFNLSVKMLRFFFLNSL